MISKSAFSWETKVFIIVHPRNVSNRFTKRKAIKPPRRQRLLSERGYEKNSIKERKQ